MCHHLQAQIRFSQSSGKTLKMPDCRLLLVNLERPQSC
jgi:hypothetical protein